MLCRLPVRRAAALALALGAISAAPSDAKADGPGLDGERSAVLREDPRARPWGRRRPEPARPHRLVTGGTPYAGSDWGLGKPSFWGIGQRPDWGHYVD